VSRRNRFNRRDWNGGTRTGASVDVEVMNTVREAGKLGEQVK
jgi:hypothetical protein